MKTKAFFFLILFFLFTAQLFSQDYAVAAKISSLGFTVEGLRKITEDFNARAGISYFKLNLSGSGSAEDFDYSGDARYFSISLLADYYPFRNNLRITGGVFFNFNKGDLTLTPTKTYRYGASVYTPAILGNVAADVSFNVVSPYLGIGIGNFTNYDNLLFSLDIGTIYHGAPEVNLSAKGLLTPTEEQEPKVNNNLNWFKFYPVIALGIIYVF